MPSAGARLEFIPDDAHFIVFPVTDGDFSRWPENTRSPAMSAREVNWFRKMTLDEKYACRWRNLVGQGIAKLLDKPDKEKYCLQSFPEGYWMFDHNKGPVSNTRHDLYLYGSKTVGRFRSPAEFIPHGYWLLTDPTLNTQNCGCKYCGGGGKKTQTEISEALGLPTNRGPTSVTGPSTGIRNGGTRPHLRVQGRGSNSSSLAGPWVPKEKRALRKMDPAWRTTSLGLDLVANSPRISDLRSGRMFRLGELVWCQWDVEILHTAKGKEVDQGLRLWPAIIIDYDLEIFRDSTSSLGFADIDIGSIVQKRRYVLRRLGTRSLGLNADHECTLSEDCILPWHAHRDLKSFSSPTSHSQPDDHLHFALRTAEKLIKFWAVCDRLPIKVPLPPATTHRAQDSQSQSPSFLTPVKPTLPSESAENVSTSARSTPAISTPYLMATTPPQRTPVRLAPASVTKAPRPQIPSPEVETPELPNLTMNTAPSQRIRELREPQSKIATITETRYQGLWYGAERIWTGDLVRLSPERQAFSESLKLSLKIHGNEKWQQRIAPVPGSNTRGVLMRIDKIFVRISESGTKECAVSGPLYEVAPEDWTDPASDSSRMAESSWQSSFPTSKGSREPTHPWDMADKPPPQRDNVHPRREFLLDVPSRPSPATCSGYNLRPLLPVGFEIPVPVSYIAGRYYPEILKSPLLTNVLPNIPKNVRSLGDFASSDWHAVELMSLCALAPGRYNYAVCVDVKLASRTGMLQEAIRLCVAELEHVKTASRAREHAMDLG